MDVIINLLQDPKTSISVVLGVMWWIEHQRAEKLQAERDALLERVVIGLTNSVTAINSSTQVSEAVRGSLNTITEFVRRQERSS